MLLLAVPAVTGFPAVDDVLAVAIGLSDYGYWTVIFSAIELSEYLISYWRIQGTIRLSDIGSRPLITV
jgi:hypothetical protein